MLSVAAMAGGSVRMGQHGAEAWWTIGSTSNSQLFPPSQHDLADAGIVRAIHPPLLVGN